MPPAAPPAAPNPAAENVIGSRPAQVSRPSEVAPPERVAAPGPDPAAAEPGNQQTAVLEALAKLGELKAMGILTEEEFTAKKTELLRRL